MNPQGKGLQDRDLQGKDLMVRPVSSGQAPPTAADPTVDRGQHQSPDQPAERLEQEIEQIRENLGGLVNELEIRRRRLNPVAVMTRNPWALAIGGAVVLGAIVGAIAARRAGARRQRAWSSRAQAAVKRGKRLRQALARAIDEPERVATSEPPIAMKLLTAAATAATAVAVRRLANQLFPNSS